MPGHIAHPGTTTNYLSTPDSAAVSVADLDVRFWVALADYTPSATRYLGGKIKDGNTREWFVNLKASSTVGVIQVASSTDGLVGTQVVKESTVTLETAASLSAWDPVAIRVTLDVDNGAADSDYNFYWKTPTRFADLTAHTGWTQIGTTVNGGSTTSIFDGDSPVEFGAATLGAAAGPQGKYYGMALFDTIGSGNPQLAIDLTDLSVTEWNAGSFTEDSSNAATVTINGFTGAYVWEPTRIMMTGIGG